MLAYILCSVTPPKLSFGGLYCDFADNFALRFPRIIVCNTVKITHYREFGMGTHLKIVYLHQPIHSKS